MPDRYADSSPITYVEPVRAPLLVLAGENDPRCPIRQIENYLARLTERGVPHEVYRFDAGHGSMVDDERVAQLRVELDFLARHLAAATEPEPRRGRDCSGRLVERPAAGPTELSERVSPDVAAES